ncbi:hypothetical protein BBG20_17585 [Pseudomonas aylmerensis]|uniref:Uncharacterized protein n=1 Tax=Pseudomonas aylmerensis TaxID=1869229 RepID=A0ABX2YVP5_9PSED|nr:hypothetical protein BBG20_17585 [Pseudomonas aylmerensis]
MRIAERLRLAGNEADTQAVPRMCSVLQADEDRMAGYADEVKAVRIVRREVDWMIGLPSAN